MHESPHRANLSQRLREECKDLHVAVERSGVMRALLTGQLGREQYCVMLRAFSVLYTALEMELARHASHPLIQRLPLAMLARRAAIAHDLTSLCGAQWDRNLRVPSSAEAYAARLGMVSRSTPELLVAHAYVRYLGDLSGGQFIASVVRRTIGDAVAFYSFGDEATVADLKARIRQACDAPPLPETTTSAIVAEAKLAFRSHLQLFDDLGSRPSATPAPPAPPFPSSAV